jgi:hypothetical protein
MTGYTAPGLHVQYATVLFDAVYAARSACGTTPVVINVVGGCM